MKGFLVLEIGDDIVLPGGVGRGGSGGNGGSGAIGGWKGERSIGMEDGIEYWD